MSSQKDRHRWPRLRAYRMRQGLTQQELADKMGISRSTLAWLESIHSHRRPGRKLAAIIAQTVGKTTAGRVMDEYDALRAA